MRPKLQLLSLFQDKWDAINFLQTDSALILSYSWAGETASSNKCIELQPGTEYPVSRERETDDFSWKKSPFPFGLGSAICVGVAHRKNVFFSWVFCAWKHPHFHPQYCNAIPLRTVYWPTAVKRDSTFQHCSFYE